MSKNTTIVNGIVNKIHIIRFAAINGMVVDENESIRGLFSRALDFIINHIDPHDLNYTHVEAKEVEGIAGHRRFKFEGHGIAVLFEMGPDNPYPWVSMSSQGEGYWDLGTFYGVEKDKVIMFTVHSPYTVLRN